MPCKFSFPTLDQAMSLQSASSLSQIKTQLRKWFNQNENIKLSQNIAWSFKCKESVVAWRRYIHCRFCQAKLIFVKQRTKNQENPMDNQTNAFRLARFNIHHNHAKIQSVRRKGKRKSFPHIYPKIQCNRAQVKKQRRIRNQTLRKRRYQLNKFKKLQLYYRLNLLVKQPDRKRVNLKACTARSLGIPQERFKAFMNSETRGVIQISAIEELLTRVGFQKYSIELEQTNTAKQTKYYQEQNYHQHEENSEDQKQDTQQVKKKTDLQSCALFFREIMIFVNYDQKQKRTLEQSQGLVNLTHLDFKVLGRKFSDGRDWDVLLLYSHDLNLTPNQLYGIIMIDQTQFNIRQIKRALQVVFKLLNPFKKLQIKCCIHQQNICIMGALDLIIQEVSSKKQQKSDTLKQTPFLSYFLSPKLSRNIIHKCQFIPKPFRSKLIDMICQLDGNEVDSQFQKIVSQIQRVCRIRQCQAKTEEYLVELREFCDNSHKIFLGKFLEPFFTSLIFISCQGQPSQQLTNSMSQQLHQYLARYSSGHKHFFQFLIMIFEVFQLPKGSFIYKNNEGQTRKLTKLQTHYQQFVLMQKPQYIDEIKKAYNLKALRSKYIQPKTGESKSDFYEQFCAILYQKTYGLREVFLRLCAQVMTVFIHQVQKSFSLQIQTRTISQVLKDGFIKVKSVNQSPYTVKILNVQRLWGKQQKPIQLEQQGLLTDLIKLQHSLQIATLQGMDKNQEYNLKRNCLAKAQHSNSTPRLWQCSCNFYKFTFLPCSHEIRCCLTFFTSIQHQIDQFWLFDPKSLQALQQYQNADSSQSENQKNSQEESGKQVEQNSQSD